MRVIEGPVKLIKVAFVYVLLFSTLSLTTKKEQSLGKHIPEDRTLQNAETANLPSTSNAGASSISDQQALEIDTSIERYINECMGIDTLSALNHMFIDNAVRTEGTPDNPILLDNDDDNDDADSISSLLEVFPKDLESICSPPPPSSPLKRKIIDIPADRFKLQGKEAKRHASVLGVGLELNSRPNSQRPEYSASSRQISSGQIPSGQIPSGQIPRCKNPSISSYGEPSTPYYQSTSTQRDQQPLLSSFNYTDVLNMEALSPQTHPLHKQLHVDVDAGMEADRVRHCNTPVSGHYITCHCGRDIDISHIIKKAIFDHIQKLRLQPISPFSGNHTNTPSSSSTLASSSFGASSETAQPYDMSAGGSKDLGLMDLLVRPSIASSIIRPGPISIQKNAKNAVSNAASSNSASTSREKIISKPESFDDTIENSNIARILHLNSSFIQANYSFLRKLHLSIIFDIKGKKENDELYNYRQRIISTEDQIKPDCKGIWIYIISSIMDKNTMAYVENWLFIAEKRKINFIIEFIDTNNPNWKLRSSLEKDIKVYLNDFKSFFYAAPMLLVINPLDDVFLDSCQTLMNTRIGNNLLIEKHYFMSVYIFVYPVYHYRKDLEQPCQKNNYWLLMHPKLQYYGYVSYNPCANTNVKEFWPDLLSIMKISLKKIVFKEMLMEEIKRNMSSIYTCAEITAMNFDTWTHAIDYLLSSIRGKKKYVHKVDNVPWEKICSNYPEILEKKYFNVSLVEEQRKKENILKRSYNLEQLHLQIADSKDIYTYAAKNFYQSSNIQPGNIHTILSSLSAIGVYPRVLTIYLPDALYANRNIILNPYRHIEYEGILTQLGDEKTVDNREKYIQIGMRVLEWAQKLDFSFPAAKLKHEIIKFCSFGLFFDRRIPEVLYLYNKNTKEYQRYETKLLLENIEMGYEAKSDYTNEKTMKKVYANFSIFVPSSAAKSCASEINFDE
ncbi:hypothetical protein NEFER03_0950 [Nematocida sp. LUAm3]|nr:hypothetical protein NEFER03_0950 [Nematocida sp. LUAm3]KAI5174968.1 hypothetical protein NEFER02_1068 [Nematocida sp. LUAm2]KAI5177433.1 hypothetical protein NEFER01_0683 [Nematocida sp. LUAm1]